VRKPQPSRCRIIEHLAPRHKTPSGSWQGGVTAMTRKKRFGRSAKAVGKDLEPEKG
jgi:hypothetical protein